MRQMIKQEHRHHIISLLTVLVVSFLPTACSDPPGLRPLADDAVILAFGDSLTYGTGATKGHDYPQLLSNLINKQVINAGIPGEITQQGVTRLPAVLDEFTPQLVILIHGGNDFLRKQNHAATRQNLLRMIQLIRSRDMDVILFGVPEPGLFLTSADVYAELATEHNLPINTDTIPTVLGTKKLKSDPIHPNDPGYRRIAEAARQLLEENGAL